MSDVSQGTFDVFMAMSNPDHTTKEQRHEYNTRRPAIRTSPTLEDVSDCEDENSDDGDNGEENESDERADDEEEDGSDDGNDDGEGDDSGEGDYAPYPASSRNVDDGGSSRESDGDDDVEDAPLDIASMHLSQARHDARTSATGIVPDDALNDTHSRVTSARPRSAATFTSHTDDPDGAFSKYIRQATHRKKNDDELHAESMEKQSMLMDLQRLRDNHGIRLSREWTMDDDIDDMSFELKRITLHIDETNNIGVMRNGLQLACTGIEMFSKRFKVLDLDGWSAEVCRDMSKHDRALARMYRKYWRRSHASSPEADIALSLVGSMGMFHMRKMLSKRMFRPRNDDGDRRGGTGMGGMRSATLPTATPMFDDDDEEELPP